MHWQKETKEKSLINFLGFSKDESVRALAKKNPEEFQRSPGFWGLEYSKGDLADES